MENSDIFWIVLFCYIGLVVCNAHIYYTLEKTREELREELRESKQSKEVQE